MALGLGELQPFKNELKRDRRYGFAFGCGTKVELPAFQALVVEAESTRIPKEQKVSMRRRFSTKADRPLMSLLMSVGSNQRNTPTDEGRLSMRPFQPPECKGQLLRCDAGKSSRAPPGRVRMHVEGMDVDGSDTSRNTGFPTGDGACCRGAQ